jgi:hypothetical protein
MTQMTTRDDTLRPRKMIAVGNQWGVCYRDAKRGDDDLCMGSIFVDGWEAIAAQIVAVPDMLAVLRICAAVSDEPDLRRAAKAALKKAGAL